MEQYGGTNMIQSPNLRKAIADANENNQVLVGSVLGIGSVANAKIIAATNSDIVWIDAEHTPYSPTLLQEVIQTIKMYSHGKIIPAVRVPNHSHEWIAWALDAGAGGVIIPHTETTEQVKAAIAAARFPPHGHRSFPPFALILGLQDTAPEGKTWLDVASEHCAVIPQIESIKGVENLEEIMQIPGVDGIMVGPGDLRLDSSNNEEFENAVARIEALAKKYRMPLVGFARDNGLAEKYKAGYRVLVTFDTTDVFVLAFGIQKGLREAREELAKARTEIFGQDPASNGSAKHENGNSA